MTLPSTEWLGTLLAIITAGGVLIGVLVKGIRELVNTFLELRKELRATKEEVVAAKDEAHAARGHAETAKIEAAAAHEHAETISHQVAEGQTKLEAIDARTQQTLENTNGSLSKVIEHADRLQTELEHVRQRDEQRNQREQATSQVVAELASTIAASQKALAKFSELTVMPGGRRAYDPKQQTG